MDLNEKFNWISVGGVLPKSFTCAHCGNQIASNFGYGGHGINSNRSSSIYICHFCTRPTYFDPDGEQIPGKAYGNDINEISDKGIQTLYHEARNATSANCYTAAILCCRKLLMHIAVSKGAKVGESFADYVEYLSKNNFVPPDAKIWVDHIRKKGNEANHEIVIMSPEDAKELIDFCEMLLKIIYEYPASIQKKYLQPKNELENQ